MARPNTSTNQRIQPLRALRAIRSLIRNPDDTGQVFQIIRALSGNSGERTFRRFRKTETGQRILAERPQLLDTLSNRQALEQLPEGSLGRRYADFVSREKITADGLVAASNETEFNPDLPENRRYFGERLRDMHDLWHVVTGLNRDLLGEASLLAFTFAQTRNPGVGFIVLVAWLRAKGDFSPARRLIWNEYQRGRRAQWLPAQEWEALLARPLEDVRRELDLGEPPNYSQVRSQGAPQLAT